MNSSLNGDYSNPYNIVATEDTTVAPESMTNQYYDFKEMLTLNNYPLCAYDPNCNTGLTPPVVVDPSLPLPGKDCGLLSRTYGVTFETIRQNIASYDYSTNLNNIKHLIRTYHLEDGKSITQEVDMRTFGVVVTKLSGDTGYPDVLTKTTIFTPLREFETTYGVE